MIPWVKSVGASLWPVAALALGGCNVDLRLPEPPLRVGVDGGASISRDPRVRATPGAQATLATGPGAGLDEPAPPHPVRPKVRPYPVDGNFFPGGWMGD